VSKTNGVQNSSLHQFKSVLLLEKSYNTTLKYTALPGIIYGLWALEILFFYGTVKSMPSFYSNIALSGFFIVTFLNLLNAIVWGNTVASKVFAESNSMIKEWKQRIAEGKNLLKLKQLRAIYPARLRIGDSFIDPSTPLVAQNFIASQTAALILL